MLGNYPFYPFFYNINTFKFYEILTLNLTMNVFDKNDEFVMTVLIKILLLHFM